MYIVEFIGVPGSGKSTIRRKIMLELKKKDDTKYITLEEAFLYSARNRVDVAYRLILKILPNFLAMKFIAKITNRSLLQFESQNKFLAYHGKAFQIFLESKEYLDLSPVDRKIVIGAFFYIGALHQLIKDANQIDNNTAVFYDEGFVQKSMMFVSSRTHRNEKKDALYDYLDHIPFPNLIIFVKTNLLTCQRRLMTRQGGLPERLQKLGSNVIAQFLTNSENHWNEVFSWLEKNSKSEIIEVDNNGSIEGAVDKLAYTIISKENQ